MNAEYKIENQDNAQSSLFATDYKYGQLRHFPGRTVCPSLYHSDQGKVRMYTIGTVAPPPLAASNFGSPKSRPSSLQHLSFSNQIFSRGSGQLRPRCVLRRRVLPACLRLTDVQKKLEGIMCADPAYAPTGPTRIREFRMKKRLMRPLHGRKMLGAHIQYSIMNLLFESSNACLAYRRSIKPSPAPFPSSNPPSSPHQLH